MTNLVSYPEQRSLLLIKIAETFSRDRRFVAGWLTGSYGRNDEDFASDIDLTLVVSDEHCEKLCRRLEQVSEQTSPERYSLFSQFGTPALIHENNHNAPEGGTFTFILYTKSALMVDWTLIPGSKAARPSQSKLLFDKAGIPASSLPEPEDLEQSKKSVAEKWAFFWMMTAVTIKYVIRGDDVFAVHWIENLHELLQDIERQIKREPWSYTQGSISRLQSTHEKQIESIRDLCQRMQGLKPEVSEFTGSEPVTPLPEIEILLSLANE
jgi:hypothetical protein